MAPKKTTTRKKATEKTTRKKTAATRTETPVRIYELKITLRGSKPPIWRRFAVPSSITLAKLHDVIQCVMGWTDSHLHQFTTVDQKRYGVLDADQDWDWGETTYDERKSRLRDLLRQPKQWLVYEYDFGDDWEHRVDLLKVGSPKAGVRYPACLGGKRACPPEDCGGVWGYYELLDTIADPRHEDHDEMLEWIGGEFDPEAFDIEQVNRMLRTVR